MIDHLHFWVYAGISSQSVTSFIRGCGQMVPGESVAAVLFFLSGPGTDSA